MLHVAGVSDLSLPCKRMQEIQRLRLTTPIPISGTALVLHPRKLGWSKERRYPEFPSRRRRRMDLAAWHSDVKRPPLHFTILTSLPHAPLRPALSHVRSMFASWICMNGSFHMIFVLSIKSTPFPTPSPILFPRLAIRHSFKSHSFSEPTLLSFREDYTVALIGKYPGCNISRLLFSS